MLLLLGARALAAPCPIPATALDLGAGLSAADAAYAAMDAEGFAARRDEARAALDCLAEPLTPMDVAAVHRLEALDGYLARDEVRTFSAYRAALAAQPAYRLPSAIAPAGNRLATLYEQAKAAGPPQRVAVAMPPDTQLFVDGVRAGDRPTDRPAVVQLVGADGRILDTAWLGVEAPLPDWSSFAPSPPAEEASAPLPAAPVAPARHGPSLPLLGGAGLSALAAGGLYGWALASRGEYDDLAQAHTTEELGIVRDRTNALVYASAGAGVAFAGLGALAVWSVTW